MPRAQIVWLRRDLRVHDHPGLHQAVAAGGAVVPVFVVDPALTDGPAASGPRASFLAVTLADLDESLRERGNRLIVRHGDPAAELRRLAREVDAAVVRWTADAAPFGRRRDQRVRRVLEAAGLTVLVDAGQYVVEPTALGTQGGAAYTVFGPFRRRWEGAARRAIHRAPRRIEAARDVGGESLPGADELGRSKRRPDVPAPVATGGETAGRAAARRWLDGPIAHYADRQDRLAGGTSELSPHLRWGTISAGGVEARARVLGGEGPAAFVRQLAWRDFFAHVYRHHPEDRHREHQERYRDLHWEDDPEGLDAWRAGRTGFPLVDAGMRQLAATGWIHNRARMVVGSFLTKDLHVDWRHGEQHFLSWLLDGEPVQNDGNWQWIASVGVDPKPYFQRLFNPTRQQQRFDPDGDYVRRWVPELERVPDALLAEPWRMGDDQQQAAGCVIGTDYPSPIVDHAEQREVAAARYREASES